MTEVERLQVGNAFWLGKIVQWHKIGRYDIAEYYPFGKNRKADTTTTHFASWVDGRDSGCNWPTLERAIVGTIALAYDGKNTQAGEFFARMVNLPETQLQEVQP